MTARCTVASEQVRYTTPTRAEARLQSAAMHFTDLPYVVQAIHELYAAALAYAAEQKIPNDKREREI